MDKREYTAPLTERLAVESMSLINSTTDKYIDQGSYDKTNNTPDSDSDNTMWGD
jgi:hypothetical protein